MITPEIVINTWKKNQHNKFTKFINEIDQHDIHLLPSFWEVLKMNDENYFFTRASVFIIFRLERNDLSDLTPLNSIINICKVEILNYGTLKDYLITISLLDVVGYDRMIPCIEDQNDLINRFKDAKPYVKTSSDPRYGLAAACAGWDKEICNEFLLDCIETGDAPVKYVAKNSLNGKYVKLR